MRIENRPIIVLLYLAFLGAFQCCNTQNVSQLKNENRKNEFFDTTYQEISIDNIIVEHETILRDEDTYLIERTSYIKQISTDGHNYFVLSDGSNKLNKNVKDYFLSKIDTKGHLIWEKTYDDDYLEQFAQGMLYRDGQIYISSTTFVSSREHNDFNVININTDGELLWSHTIDLPNYQVPGELFITDDNIYCVGRNVIRYKPITVQVCKFNMDGTAAQCNEQESSYNGFGYSINELNDSTLILLSIHEEEDRKWVKIIGVDKDLNYRWTKKVIQVTGDRPDAQMIVDKQGNIYVQSQVGIDSFGYQILVTKLNPNGHIIWNKAYGLDSVNRLDKRTFIHASPNDDIIIGGNTGSLFGTGINYFFEINPSGEVNWSSQFSNSYGYLTDISTNADSTGYVISGYSRKSLNYEEVAQGFILSVDAHGQPDK